MHFLQKEIKELNGEERENLLDKLEEVLPHGSGIDCQWKFEIDLKNRIICTNSIHCMNEDGYYDGHMAFKVTFFQIKKNQVSKLNDGNFQITNVIGDWDMKINYYGTKSKYKESWDDHLYEMISYAIQEGKIFPQFGMRSGLTTYRLL